MKRSVAFTLLALAATACSADNVLRPSSALSGTAPGAFGALIQAICPAPPSGLVSWWRADGSGDDATGGNPATLSNGATFAPGQVASAFQLDGLDDDLLIGTKANLDVGAGGGLTIESWIFPEGSSSATLGNGAGPIVEWDNGVHFWQYAPTGGLSGLYANLVDAAGAFHIYSVSTGVTQNAWNHVALTYDKASGATTMYINGGVATSVNIGSLSLKTSTDLHVGRRSTTSFVGTPLGAFKGKLDDVQIYDRSLSAAEIQAIYNSGASGACNLVADAGPAVNATEGSEVLLNGSASTGQSTTTFDWDFGDGTPHATTKNASHKYKDNGVYTATLTLTDGALTSAGTTTATIGNALPVPTLTLQTTGTIHVGQPFVLRAGFKDAGVLDGPWGYKFFRNTTLLQQGTKAAQPPTGVTQPVTLTQATAGTFTFKLQITDKDGGVGTVSLPVVIAP